MTRGKIHVTGHIMHKYTTKAELGLTTERAWRRCPATGWRGRGGGPSAGVGPRSTVAALSRALEHGPATLDCNQGELGRRRSTTERNGGSSFASGRQRCDGGDARHLGFWPGEREKTMWGTSGETERYMLLTRLDRWRRKRFGLHLAVAKAVNTIEI